MPMFVVTATMLAPIAIHDCAIHLDSLIIQMMARHQGVSTGALDRRCKKSELKDVRIPIARIDKVPLCSAAHIESPKRSGLEHITKRKDATDIHRRARPWSVGSGPEKLYCLPIPTIHCKSLTWICHGSRGKELRKIFKRIRYIGGERSQGFGRVGGWSVERTDADPWRAVLTPDGRAARHIPRDWCESAEHSDDGGFTCPYWLTNESKRVRAGTRCKLSPAIYKRLERIK